MTDAEIREGLEVHACNVQTAALILPPPKPRVGDRHWPPEDHDRHEYDMAVVRALAWQRDTILRLLDRPAEDSRPTQQRLNNEAQADRPAEGENDG